MKIPKEFEDVFHGVELTEDEVRTLHWLVSWERQTVDNLRSAIQKAQATALSTLQTENEKLRAELEQVELQRDAAQIALAETSGLAGGVVQTLFGVPLERMRELAKAELEGRIVLRSAGAGKKCGSCGHFHRIPGTKRGTCDIRQWERNRLGQTEPWRHSFTPSQSYGACREYVRGESSATE